MSALLVFAGFALLAAGTHRQAGQLFGRDPGRRVRHALLALGYAALAGSLLPLPRDAAGWVRWCELLTPAALLPVLLCWALAGRRARGPSPPPGR